MSRSLYCFISSSSNRKGVMVFSFSNFISCVPFLIVFTISKWNHVILGFSHTSEKLSLQVGTWKRWYLGLIDLHVWLNFNSFYLKSLWSLGCPMIEVDCFSLNWIKPRWCWDSLCNLVNRWALYDARILPKLKYLKTYSHIDAGHNCKLHTEITYVTH